MHKKIVKFILGINDSTLNKLTKISGIGSAVYLFPQIVEILDIFFSSLNSDYFKDINNMIKDIVISYQKFKWLGYLAIFIFILCLIAIYIRYKYKDKEIIDKVIIAHGSMSKAQFMVETADDYKIEHIDLIEDMKDIKDDYDKIKYAINKQDGLVKSFKDKLDNKHEYGYMGIAHTPLVLRMGNQIGDENEIKLFHKSRTKENNIEFKELNMNKNFKELIIESELLDRDSDELIVGLSTTYIIKYDELNIFNPDEKNIIIFKYKDLEYLDIQGFDVIESIVQVRYYTQYIMNNIQRVVKEKNISKIHMVLSTSTAMTFALGQAISLNNYPNVIIYHYDINDSRKYTWGIDLSKDYRNCLVDTNIYSKAK